MVGSVRKFGDSEEEDWIRELMDKAFERLRSPLRVSPSVHILHPPSALRAVASPVVVHRHLCGARWGREHGTARQRSSSTHLRPVLRLLPSPGAGPLRTRVRRFLEDWTTPC